MYRKMIPRGSGTRIRAGKDFRFFSVPAKNLFGHEPGPDARSRAETLGIRSPGPGGSFLNPSRPPPGRKFRFFPGLRVENSEKKCFRAPPSYWAMGKAHSQGKGWVFAWGSRHFAKIAGLPPHAAGPRPGKNQNKGFLARLPPGAKLN